MKALWKQSFQWDPIIDTWFGHKVTTWPKKLLSPLKYAMWLGGGTWSKKW